MMLKLSTHRDYTGTSYIRLQNLDPQIRRPVLCLPSAPHLQRVQLREGEQRDVTGEIDPKRCRRPKQQHFCLDPLNGFRAV